MSDSVPNYQSDGMENFRANPTQRESPGPQSTPSTQGKPAGGTDNLRANYKCYHDAPNQTPTGGSGPSTPQHFTDDKV
jgi:hypothetical protein